MIYLDNTNEYSQRVFIPKDEATPTSGVTGETIVLQRKDYEFTENGAYLLHPDAGYDGISGGTISVYVPQTTSGVTYEHLDATEDGIYVATGNTAFSGVTVQVYDGAYQDGYHDGFEAGYTSGYTDGYSSGATDGYASGSTDGYNEGYASGHTDGYAEGYASGNTDGYASGQTDGYDSGYTEGFEAGYTSGHTKGYLEGFADGEAAQKAKMVTLNATKNRTYTREDGWNTVNVQLPLGSLNTTIGQNQVYTFRPEDYNVEGFSLVQITGNFDFQSYFDSGYTSGYTEGYASGETDGYASGYTSGETDGYASGYTSGSTDGYASGYTSGTTDGYQDGYFNGRNDGITYQKSLLGVTSLTYNDTFTSENGWSSVTVNVPTVVNNTTLNIDATSSWINSNSHYQLVWEPASGYSGYRQVTLDLHDLTLNNALPSATYTKNGSYTISGDTGNTYYKQANVTVNVPLGRMSISNNGTYSASTSGYEGFSVVEVNVSGGSATQIVTCTQAEYDQLNPPDPNTIYLIKD